MKHLYARMKTRATILCSTNGALNLLLLGENSPRMSKNSQKSKMGSCGNAKCSVPVEAKPIKLRLSNVFKAVLQKCGSGSWQLAPTVLKILPIFLKNHDFRAFSEVVFRVYLHTQASPGKVTSYQS